MAAESPHLLRNSWRAGSRPAADADARAGKGRSKFTSKRTRSLTGKRRAVMSWLLSLSLGTTQEQVHMSDVAQAFLPAASAFVPTLANRRQSAQASANADAARQKCLRHI